MDFSLSTEQLALQELAGSVGSRFYAPSALSWDRDRTALPPEERRRLADLGFLGIVLPEEFGGSGGGLLDGLLVIEELAKHNQVAAFQVFEANTGPARVIELFGTEEQRQRILPAIVKGEATMAVAISEADAGSAATDLRTTARRDGDHYIINGSKRWCSGAGHAEHYLVYARLSDAPGAAGVGALVVDRDSPGVAFGPQEHLLGFHGIPSADISFDDVKVPVSNLVVPAGGFKQLFSAFSIERLGNATMSLAIGQACVDRVGRHIAQREQFGRPIVEFQMVQQQFADMIMQVEAARLLVWRAASRAGSGIPDPLEASIAKCFANEMAKKVSDSAIQLHGGYGYHPEYHVERFHRDAIGWTLAGGTPAMQRIRIVSQYLKRSLTQRNGSVRTTRGA